MKQRVMPLNDLLLLRKRSIIETIINQLKNISRIEHSRHRSPINCFVNILGGLIAIDRRSLRLQSTTICFFRLNL